MLSILDLPDELLTYIFEHVKGRHALEHGYHERNSTHVKDVRLTCKRFCGISSPLLIHRLALEITQEGLSRLENVCSHPDISRGVEHIAISFRIFAAVFAHKIWMFARYLWHKSTHDLYNYEKSDSFNAGDETEEERQKVLHDVAEMRAILKSWARCVFDYRVDKASFAAELEEGIAQETSGHLLVLKKAYEQYRHEFDQQQQLLANSTFTDAVAYACSRFPRFSKLELHDHDHYSRSSRWGNPRWRAGIADLERLPSLMIDSMRLDQASHWRHEIPTEMTRMPINLPIAIHKAGSWLTRFDIHLSDPPHLSSWSMNEDETADLHDSMQRLQCSNFVSRCNMCDPKDRRPDRDEAEMSNFRAYMSTIISTNTLEHLNIDFNEYYTAAPDYETSSIMTLCKWPKLYSVKISGLSFFIEDLTKFLNRLQSKPHHEYHHDTLLDDFVMRSMYLKSGSWEEVLDLLKSKARLNRGWSVENPRGADINQLSREEYKRIFTKPKSQTQPSEESSAANAYIRGFSNQNPFREPEGTNNTQTNDVTEDA